MGRKRWEEGIVPVVEYIMMRVLCCSAIMMVAPLMSNDATLWAELNCTTGELGTVTTKNQKTKLVQIQPRTNMMFVKAFVHSPPTHPTPAHVFLPYHSHLNC